MELDVTIEIPRGSRVKYEIDHETGRLYLDRVPTDKRYDHIKSLADVPEQLKAEIQHFFERYKDLEPGKWVKGEGWDDIAAAEKMVQEAIDRFAAEGH